MYTNCLTTSLAVILVSILGMSNTAHARDIMPPPIPIQRLMQLPIDVHAQRSLVRLSNGTKDQRFRAYYMFRGVQMGALGGIYIVDQGVPALRAKALGKGWWMLLEGRPAMCWMEPAGERPLLLMGKETVLNNTVLDAALLQAFHECGFRELEVEVIKSGIPCTPLTSLVTLVSAELGINFSRHPTENGVTHFSMPPAMYAFHVECEGQKTTPNPVFRAVVPGDSIQRERFDF